MKNEKWKKVAGAEWYEFSNLGRLKNGDIFVTPEITPSYEIVLPIVIWDAEKKINVIALNENVFSEWIDKQYDLLSDRRIKKIGQYTIGWDFIESFPSARSAYRKTWIAYQSIAIVAKGIRQTAGGFKWKFI